MPAKHRRRREWAQSCMMMHPLDPTCMLKGCCFHPIVLALPTMSMPVPTHDTTIPLDTGADLSPSAQVSPDARNPKSKSPGLLTLDLPWFILVSQMDPLSLGCFKIRNFAHLPRLPQVRLFHIFSHLATVSRPGHPTRPFEIDYRRS